MGPLWVLLIALGFFSSLFGLVKLTDHRKIDGAGFSQQSRYRLLLGNHTMMGLLFILMHATCNLGGIN
jgi:hypothetical protein